MTTDPSMPRATVQSPRQVTRVVSVASPGAVIGAILTLVLGLALGIANQGASGTEMGLRVPALLAALLMVGQGVVDLRKNLRRQVEIIPEATDSRGRELAVVRPMPPQQPVSVLTTRPSPSTLTVPLCVLFLASWLGLADLRIEAPASLSTLSLISAFALFAIGWGLLPARR
jgi:hypothetical protein